MSWTKAYTNLKGSARSLTDIVDLSRLVELSEEVGKGLAADKASANQMRGLLSETNAALMRIRTSRSLGPKDENTAARNEASFLNASLMYAAGRDKQTSGSIKQLAELVRSITQDVYSLEDFKILRKFSEGIAAYYKFHQNEQKQGNYAGSNHHQRNQGGR